MLVRERWNLFETSIETAEPAIYTKKQKFCFFIKFLWLKLVKGVYLIDFLQYKFYEKNKYGRKKFIEYQSLHKIMQLCNDPNYDRIFDNKKEFNQHFESFIGRPWMVVKGSTYDEFLKFIKRYRNVFIKPEVGSFGQGVSVLTFDDQVDYRKTYEKLTSLDAIVETVIRQAPELASFNDSSLNTLRIVTLIDKTGKTHIMSALLRMGRVGKVADNFHHEGIAAKIDIATGIVCTTGIDREFTRYSVHPDSKKEIIGFRIPMWEKVQAFVIALSKNIPATRYVGWDIAIDRNYNIICVEGNRGADPDVTQVTDKTGKYYEFMKLI